MNNDSKSGFMPTCAEVHRLVSEGLDRELSLTERARVRLHLMICDACTTFSGQMKLLRQAMRQWSLPDEPENDRELK
jgi:predicted anti-sigma-YlaC factor YlaD